MINIGAVISGRYEIIEKIGTGGMADVYRAKDHYKREKIQRQRTIGKKL